MEFSVVYLVSDCGNGKMDFSPSTRKRISQDEDQIKLEFMINYYKEFKESVQGMESCQVPPEDIIAPMLKKLSPHQLSVMEDRFQELESVTDPIWASLCKEEGSIKKSPPKGKSWKELFFDSPNKVPLRRSKRRKGLP